jgi:hypothetical protein
VPLDPSQFEPVVSDVYSSPGGRIKTGGVGDGLSPAGLRLWAGLQRSRRGHQGAAVSRSGAIVIPNHAAMGMRIDRCWGRRWCRGWGLPAQRNAWAPSPALASYLQRLHYPDLTIIIGGVSTKSLF